MAFGPAKVHRQDRACLVVEGDCAARTAGTGGVPRRLDDHTRLQKPPDDPTHRGIRQSQGATNLRTSGRRVVSNVIENQELVHFEHRGVTKSHSSCQIETKSGSGYRICQWLVRTSRSTRTRWSSGPSL